MDEIGKITLKTFSLFGHTFSYNPQVFIMTWLVMVILIILAFLVRKKLAFIPGKIQIIAELLVQFFKDICVNTLGDEDGKRFFPLIFTLFIFILLANWIGIIPNIFAFIGFIIALIHKFLGGQVQIHFAGHGIFSQLTHMTLVLPSQVWYSIFFHIPAIEEPTKFLNTDLALAILVFIVVHVNSIKSKGVINYICDYMDPLPKKAPYIYFFFLNPFFYLNIVGELAKVVSHSFRLFGNIFGGSIIIIIISDLLRYILVPVGLFMFFGLFSGMIQAFVFTMLAVTYIAVMK